MKKLIYLLALLTAFSVYAVDTVITITHDDSSTQISNQIDGATKHEVINDVINYMKAIRNGSRAASLDVQVGEGDAVAASGTLTITGAFTAGDTITIGPTTLTAVNEASIASDVLFNIGTGSNAAVTNVTSTINGNSTLSAAFTATASVGEVLLTADQKGVTGNYVSTTESSTVGSWSDVVLRSGTEATANSYDFGR